MTLTTIGMISSYGGLTQADWLWNQTPQALGRWRGVQLQATAPRPDWLLLYQYDFHKVLQPASGSTARRWLRALKAGKRPAPARPDPAQVLPSVLHQTPPERTLFLLREPPLPEVALQNQHNYDHARTYCGYVSGPDDAAPTPAYMPAIWYVDGSFEELNTAPPPEKLRPCSWITSGVNRTENHRRRLAFLRQVQDAQLGIDFYGRNLPPWVDSPGWLQRKRTGMAPYTYNLAIENYADNDWYASEKLWDALLAWCLPIYYGGPAADALLPPGSFLRLPSLDQVGVDFIREVIASPDAWYAAKDAIAEARQIILHKLNLMNWLADHVEAAQG